MHDIAPAAPEREHVVFIPRKPGIESIEHTIERGARNELARLYPLVQVQTDAMFVEDGGVITTGAFSSGFE